MVRAVILESNLRSSRVIVPSSWERYFSHTVPVPTIEDNSVPANLLGQLQNNVGKVVEKGCSDLRWNSIQFRGEYRYSLNASLCVRK